MSNYLDKLLSLTKGRIVEIEEEMKEHQDVLDSLKAEKKSLEKTIKAHTPKPTPPETAPAAE